MLEIDILLSFVIFLFVIVIILNFSHVYIEEKIENYKIQKSILNSVLKNYSYRKI